MFTEKTVIILGAGASWHYGYPTGEELVEGIVEAAEHLKDEDPKLRGFIAAITEVSPLNIDYFLFHHNEYAEIGKKLIAYVILKYQQKIDRKTGHRNRYRSDFERDLAVQRKDIRHDYFDDGNWYKFLVDKILSGCQKPHEILGNKLSFITFNYDNSLEYYLHNTLSRISFLKTEKYHYGSEFLKRLEITHVYGQIYKKEDFNTKTYEQGSAIFSSTGNGFDILQHQRWDNHQQYNLLQQLTEQNSIEVIGIDKTKNHERFYRLREKIEEAKNIFILGYGFDPNNSDLLFYEKNKQGERTKNIITTDVHVSDEDEAERCCKNIYYTNMGNSLKINQRMAEIAYDYPAAVNDLHDNYIFKMQVQGRIRVTNREGNSSSTSPKFIKCTKSTKSVYDALAYDFDF